MVDALLVPRFSFLKKATHAHWAGLPSKGTSRTGAYVCDLLTFLSGDPFCCVTAHLPWGSKEGPLFQHAVLQAFSNVNGPVDDIQPDTQLEAKGS